MRIPSRSRRSTCKLLCLKRYKTNCTSNCSTLSVGSKLDRAHMRSLPTRAVQLGFNAPAPGVRSTRTVEPGSQAGPLKMSVISALAEARLLPDYKQHDRGTLCGGVPDHIKPPFVGVAESSARCEARIDVT